jgi:hypothetical protein
LKTRITVISNDVNKASELMRQLTKGIKKVKSSKYIIETEDEIYYACRLTENMRGMVHQEVYIDDTVISTEFNKLFDEVVYTRIYQKEAIENFKREDHIHYI